jgi:central kinetochore subunit Mis15/CHL4
MAPRPALRAPTNASIPDSLRVPSTTKTLLKSLIRLSKSSLIDLALRWLQEENKPMCAPYLASNRNFEEEVDEDYLWTPAESVEELRLTYHRMRFEAHANKRYIVDRILDGDWRRGLSLYQVASIDFQSLSENDKALRWTALKLVSRSDDEECENEPLKKRRKMHSAPYPTVSPSTFLRNLQHDIAPLVKAHYTLHQSHTTQDLSIIRICLAESPYTNPQPCVQSPSLFTDPNRIIFIALPGSCPYIYVSVSGATGKSSLAKRKSTSAGTDVTSLKSTVLEEIPKALSKSQHRYALESTALTARSLSTMLALRGNSGTNAANGVYTIFAKGVVDNSPIDAEKTSFAQKILQASEGKEDKEHDLTISELSLKPQEQAWQRTAFDKRSINISTTGTPRSEEDKSTLNIAATTLFGVAGLPQHDANSQEYESAVTTGGLDRLQIRLDEDLLPLTERQLNANGSRRHVVDPFDQASSLEPAPGTVHKQGSASMTVTFQGSDILLGIRSLVELGLIRVDKLPTWMTGEEGISGGTVRNGVVVRGKGGGA